tara:strand:+ start:4370 stop:4567 length:198 start_codon:yes stop_codon:yes gene_type:complete
LDQIEFLSFSTYYLKILFFVWQIVGAIKFRDLFYRLWWLAFDLKELPDADTASDISCRCYLRIFN